MEVSKTVKPKRKRGPIRYWVMKRGILYARLQYEDETGRSRDKYRPITDKREARKTVEAMRSELEKHGEEFFRSEKMTFDELADKYEEVEFVEAVFQNGVKIKGRKSLASVKSSIKPLRNHFGRKHIRSIKPTDITNYKNQRLSTPVEFDVNEKIKVIDETTGREKTRVIKIRRVRERKIASVNRELELLRAILNYGEQNSWLARNPFAKTKKAISKAAEAERDRVLSYEEEQRLLDTCTDRKAHLKPILICALDTAMRRGEIFKMKWADVDFLTNEITVPQTNTKTEETRTVGMTLRLREELKALWKRSAGNLDSPVIGISNTIKNAFKSACEEAKITDFRFHDCRHTATTRMVASGSPHTEVMKITGHSQLKTFLRYLNITTETASRVASRLDNYRKEMNPATRAIESSAVN